MAARAVELEFYPKRYESYEGSNVFYEHTPLQGFVHHLRLKGVFVPSLESIAENEPVECIHEDFFRGPNGLAAALTIRMNSGTVHNSGSSRAPENAAEVRMEKRAARDAKPKCTKCTKKKPNLAMPNKVICRTCFSATRPAKKVDVKVQDFCRCQGCEHCRIMKSRSDFAKEHRLNCTNRIHKSNGKSYAYHMKCEVCAYGARS